MNSIAVEDVQQLIADVAFPRRPTDELKMPHLHP